MSDNLFLTPEQVRRLTDFSTKEKQIAQLRKMGIPFFVNGAGRPVVTRAAVEGRRTEQQPQAQGWKPAVLHGDRKAA